MLTATGTPKPSGRDFFQTSAAFREWLEQHHGKADAQALIEQRRMQPNGLKAYRARKENKSGVYSYEQRRADLEEPYKRLLEENKVAWDFFQTQPASYRKVVSWWIISAKKEETRLKRLEKLIANSVQGQRLPEFAPRKTAH